MIVCLNERFISDKEHCVVDDKKRFGIERLHLGANAINE